MAPKGGNAKKESGRAKKAENEAKKQAAASVEKERKEAEKWEEGAKGKSSKDEKEEKRKAELARKAENARLLAEEESAAPSKVKSAPKAGSKSKAAGTSKPAGPGAIAAGGGLESVDDKPAGEEEQAQSYAATGLDNVLDLLDAVTAKTDKASIGAQAATIERHPERRYKAAYAAFEERELPIIRSERPGLRLQQYKELLFKKFEKSPDNPFNQTTVAYDASKEEKVEALKAKRAQVEERLRTKNT